MKKLNIKNLKLLKYGKGKLIGNLGIWAEANKNKTISYRLMKRIKKKSPHISYSPFRCTLGYFPDMSIKEAEQEAKKIITICNRGIHPRKKVAKNIEFSVKKNLKKKILIIGTGGHAMSVSNIIQSLNYKIIAYVDNKNAGKKFNNIKIINDDDAIYKYSKQNFVIAIGDNDTREQVYKYYQEKNSTIKFPAVIHSSAVISFNTQILDGTVIMPNVTVGPNSIIEQFCILNTNSSIDHDCYIKSFSSLAPGVTTGGEVKIGKKSVVSLGSNIKNGITIGNNVLVGASSYVNKNIVKNVVSYGIPAKIIRKRKKNEKYL
jgi:sugar O-acyltransferase (sialic acid O-acetyltransferase NeuD family)